MVAAPLLALTLQLPPAGLPLARREPRRRHARALVPRRDRRRADRRHPPRRPAAVDPGAAALHPDADLRREGGPPPRRGATPGPPSSRSRGSRSSSSPSPPSPRRRPFGWACDRLPRQDSLARRAGVAARFPATTRSEEAPMFRPIAAAVCLAWGAPALAAGRLRRARGCRAQGRQPVLRDPRPSKRGSARVLRRPRHHSSRDQLRAQASHRVERRLLHGGLRRLLRPAHAGRAGLRQRHELRSEARLRRRDHGRRPLGHRLDRCALGAGESHRGGRLGRARRPRDREGLPGARRHLLRGGPPHLHLRRVLHRRPHGEHARGQGSRALRAAS